MAEGLVQRQSLPQGVGRPQHCYSLTDAGRRHFPSRYHVLAAHLLNALKDLRTDEDIHDLLAATVHQLLAAPAYINSLPPEKRLRLLAAHLQTHGFPLRITGLEARRAQIVLDCPYYYISQQHPELCSIGQEAMADTLQMPLQRTSCLLHGSKSCTFSIELVDRAATVLETTRTGSD